MTESELQSYREPATPTPELFPLVLAKRARIAALVALACTVLGVVLFAFFDTAAVFLFGALGPAVSFLLAGAPRLIEVHHDRVVVRSWLRRTHTIPARDLMVQVTDEDLLLAHDHTTLSIDLALFPEGSLPRCVSALRAIAARWIASR